MEVDNNGLIIAAVLAVVTDWEHAEIRAGRRGEYRTTGASQYRIREQLTPEQVGQLRMIVGALGVDTDEEELLETFNGDFEFQISYACNRFIMKAGAIGRQRLTNNEMRTLERAKQILVNKEEAAVHVLTTPERKAA